MVIAIVGLSLLWAVGLAFNIPPELRGGYGWQWPYQPVSEGWRLAPLAILLGVYSCGVFWALRKPSAKYLIIIALGASLSLAWACLFVRGEPLEQLYLITISGQATGWHLAATRIQDIHTTLREWPAFMQSFTGSATHMSISPPGMAWREIGRAATHREGEQQQNPHSGFFRACRLPRN